jgi:hypothetical protein
MRWMLPRRKPFRLRPIAKEVPNLKLEPRPALDKVAVPPSTESVSVQEQQDLVERSDNLSGQIEFDAELLGQPRPLTPH